MSKLKNSLIALAGLTALALITSLLIPLVGLGSNAPGGNAPTSQTQNVNVVNTPTVAAQQSGTWNVAIDGTPTVNLAAGSSVNIGTPTVNVSATSTAIAYEDTLIVQQAPAIVLTPEINVSSFKQIRVIVSANGSTDYAIYMRILDSNNVPFSIENMNDSLMGAFSKIYDLPGQKIDFLIDGGTGQSSVHVLVFGRSN